VDVFAPGVQITSAGIGSDKDTQTLSGTSMSWSVFFSFAALGHAPKLSNYPTDSLLLVTSPHVAGLAAAILSREGRMTPAQLEARIKELATASVRGQPTDTTNVIAFNGAVFKSR
jgi:subtilisin family serine protease